MSGDQTDDKGSSQDAWGFFKGSKNKVDKHDSVKVQPFMEIPEVDRLSDFYNMGHYRRGTAIIFNHQVFDDHALNKRDGTMKDSRDLEETLRDLRFDVKVYNDLKYGAIYEIIQSLASANHSDSDCLVVAVLSHGDSGKIYARDHQYPPDTLWRPFAGDKCVTLAGKPKLFFLQACRGDDVDDGVAVRSPVTTADAASVYTIPAMADILVMYSTYEGYYSWRSPVSGSWFIQSLCSELRRSARERDILTILTFVNRNMALNYQSNVPGNAGMHAKKQIGTIVSTLTRLLYFHPPRL